MGRPQTGAIVSAINGTDSTGTQWLRHLAPVLGLMLLGACLRMYRLGDQSVWLDEFLSVANLNAGNGRESLRLLGLYFPEHERCPTFYALFYYWAQLVGQNLFTLRMLPVLLGIGTIPLLYCFMRAQYGTRAAFVAALCYTLSPQHIWHAQEIRQYCLVMPLVIIALYALLRALRGGGVGCWAINVAAGTLLVWTHALNAVFLLTEGVFLLFFLRGNIRAVLLWGVAQVSLLAPWALWLLTMPYMYEIRGDTTLGTVVNDMLLDEMVSHHTDILPPYKTNPLESLGELAKFMLPWQPWFDAAMTAFTLAAVAALLIALLRHFQSRNEPDGQSRLRSTLLMVVLLIVPNLVLGLLCKIFHAQVIGPMYAMYNTLGLYAGFGLLLSRIPTLGAYAMGIAALCLLYACQLALVLPETTRSNWLGIARHLQEHGGIEDRVFDIQSYGPASYLPYNWPERSLPIERVWTLEAAVDDATHFIADAATDTGIDGPSAWIVYEEFMLGFRWEEGPAVMQEALRQRGLHTERLRFPGHYNAGLIRVWGRPTETTDGPVPADNSGADYVALLTELGLDTGNPQTNEARLKALRRYVPYWPPIVIFFATFQADWALAEGQMDVARALQEWVLKTRPEFGLAHFGYGLLQSSEMQPSAEESFQKAYMLHPGLEQLFGNYVETLLHQQDCSKCLAEVDKLESKGYIAFAPALRAACQSRAQGLP